MCPVSLNSYKVHKNSGFSKIKIRKQKTALDVLVPDIKMNKDALDTARQLYATEAKHVVDFTNVKAKELYNAKHQPIRFKVGDEVYLNLHQGYHLPGSPP